MNKPSTVRSPELANPEPDASDSENKPIAFAMPDIGEEEIQAAVDSLRSGWLTTGPRAAAFESEFAEFLGGGLHAVAVNSATAGLHLALEAIGIEPGDEVLVPTWTFTATAEVVRHLGANPVFVDVDAATLNLDLQRAQNALTARTRAVIPVHFAGLPVSTDELNRFARLNNLAVVEDAAHAFPASSGGSLVGTGPSDAVVFSFYATKTITTGEGGMLVTRDTVLADRARTMRLHGIDRDVFHRYRGNSPSWRYEVIAPGFKYNLTDPAAAIGRVQLRRAWAMRDRRAGIARRYQEAFADLAVRLPVGEPPGGVHAWHLFVLTLTDHAPVDRDTFIAEMSSRGIGCSVHFTPLHLQPFWRDSYSLQADAFPVASAASETTVSIPLYSSMTENQIDRVIAAVRSVLGTSTTNISQA